MIQFVYQKAVRHRCQVCHKHSALCSITKSRNSAYSPFSQSCCWPSRESVQSHQQITWLFAGSHEITELPNAQWTSYLLSARTIEIPPFTPQETRLLLTEPLKHSQLWKDPATRPRFSPEFWGEGGIERIQHEADGWRTCCN
jgi:hypothetical protein